jgi:haloacid dehalogenase-like hydrolase
MARQVKKAIGPKTRGPAARTKAEASGRVAATKTTKRVSAKPVAGGTAKAATPAPGYTRKTLALIYDFDGTLCPRPMQEYAFLPKIGENPEAFWTESNRIAREQGADPLITYMHLLYKKAKAKGVRIDRSDLVAQGAAVEFYPGVSQWFDATAAYLRSIAGDQGVTLRHYLISSGLTEIVEGTPIFKKFHNVFASEYWFDAYDLPFPKRVITDTGKTQYLFRINKGIENLGESINHHMPEAERPIPFSNMIYFGDGDTDVPSMAVVRKNGGRAIAVHGGDEVGRSKCVDLFRAGRCDFFADADYRASSALFKRTCLLMDRMVADIRISEEMWALEKK